MEAVHDTKEKEIDSVVVESYFYVISLVVLERTNIDYFVVEEEELKHSEYSILLFLLLDRERLPLLLFAVSC